jgi:hypothetical protein
VVVPPIVTFPLMVKSELMFVTPLTVRPVNIGLSVSVIVAPTPDAVAVRLPLTKLMELTLVPTGLPSSLIVIPVIAPASAAATQVGVAPTPFD